MENVRFVSKEDIEMATNLLPERKPREKLTVLGTGDFCRALTKRLSTAGYHVVMGIPFKIVSLNDALEHSGIIFLAISLHGYDSLLTSSGSQLNGKIVVHVSNRTQTSFNELSNAEYLSSLLPKAHVVKDFNVISAWELELDIYGGSRTVYICGDNAEAKEKIMQISRRVHFTPLDQGSLKGAQAIEEKPMELFPSWRPIILGFLYFVMWLFFILAYLIRKVPFTTFPLREISIINAFTVIGLLDMVYLPGCIAAIVHLVYDADADAPSKTDAQTENSTKYCRFPKWFDIWMESRKQLSDKLTMKVASKHFLLFLIGEMSLLYIITTAKYHLDLLDNGGCSMTFTNELYAVKKTGSFYKRSPPTEESESWIKSAQEIGTNGWAGFKFLFLGPDGDLYAVRKDGTFWKGSPPKNGRHSWSDRATKIGNNGWADFKFLFFGQGSDLYAVRKDGTFLKGSPPKNARDSWSTRATKIGNNGWADFKFLFFGPHCNLYAVQPEGSIFTTYEPKDRSDRWLDRAKKIGTKGWQHFKFLFFGPGGYLYAVPCDGSLQKAPPPTNANDTWISRSTKISAKGWASFVFLF